MDRRDFLKRSANKLASQVLAEAERRIYEQAKHWIRPPYACDEVDFLLGCTRCQACIEACSYNVIFPLGAHLGADVAGTPALDLVNDYCRLCDDWPCVTACEPRVLALPEVEENEDHSLPVLAWAQVNTGTCLPWSGPECGACQDICPVDGALVWQDNKPRIQTDRCPGCGACRQACITDPSSVTLHSSQDKTA